MGFFRRKGDEYHRIIFYWGFPKTRLLFVACAATGHLLFCLETKKKTKKFKTKRCFSAQGPVTPAVLSGLRAGGYNWVFSNTFKFTGFYWDEIIGAFF
jgi:hypothetical protein